jgi:DUF1365 family protein
MTLPAAQLWFGKTAHTRQRPFKRGFTHRIAMLEIDIDRLDEADKLSNLLSVGRGNLISFRPADYGARTADIPLRAWAEGKFAEAGIDLGGGPIRLLTFPRVLGYGFAPISLWYGFASDSALRGVIYEVHNTFGEAHAYVSALHPVEDRQTADKEFHVSPFFAVEGKYRFGLRRSHDALSLTVVNFDAEGPTHTASLVVHPRAVTSGQVLKWMIAMPISGLGVMFAIHWQALRLWLKGARYRDKPVQRERRTTLAQPEGPRSDAPRATVTTDLRKRA